MLSEKQKLTTIMKLGGEIAASMERCFPVTETATVVLPAARYI
jgi:hypothetical protein